MITLAPTMHGITDRRMLLNFRARPEIVAKLLPAPFRPKLVNGWAMVGICLIRLKDVRPRGLPALCGLDSENAAHRIAVEWQEGGETREGVFIPRRDTSSQLQTWVGGRIFPGVHHYARFEVNETATEFGIEMRSEDGLVNVGVRASLADWLDPNSVFWSLAEASDFFARSSVGYSATCESGCWDGLALHTVGWKVEPLKVSTVKSSFFDDRARFAKGTIEFYSALLMRGVDHEWHALPQMHRPERQS